MFGSALALASGVRLALIAVALIAGFAVLDSSAPAWKVVSDSVNRWDAPHFISIAQNGYLPSDEARLFIVFFPLFPLAVSLVHYFVPDYVAAGLFVSLAASVAAGFFLQALVRIDYDFPTAKRALWAFFLFPTAYFLALPYTEAIFLACAIASVYFARKGNWMHAGIAGFLASLARIHGLALFPALALEAWMQLNGGKLLPSFLQKRTKANSRQRLSLQTSTLSKSSSHLTLSSLAPFAWILLVPIGFAAYLALNASVLGSPLAFMEIQRNHWHHAITFSLGFFAEAARTVSSQPPSYFNALVFLAPLAALAFAVLVLLASAKWMRPSYQVFAWALLLPSLADSWPISLPRYLLAAFPLFIAIAVWTKDSRARTLVLTASAVLMAALFFLFALGRWAF
jgi:hypothetical protein